MVELKNQEDLFKIIGDRLNNKIECFVIGGSAMMYYGAKDGTKDIDLVFIKEADRDAFVNVLIRMGYKEKNSILLYSKKRNAPLLLEFDGSRFDLFLNTVVSFKLTQGVKERIKKIIEHKNLIIKVASPEDILLMKCATERAGDRLDAKGLIEKCKFDWGIIIDESTTQIEFGNRTYPLFLYGFLMELKEDLKVDLPGAILEKIEKMIEEKLLNKS